MTSILKVDTIQDADGNNIINESGNTITIGASGDTTNIIGTLQNDGSALVTGKVLQVVSTANTSAITGNNSSFADSGFSVTITPSATSSKILILTQIAAFNDTTATSMYYSIYRGTTNLGDSSVGFVRTYNGGSNLGSSVAMNFLDSPSTTSATEYSVYVKVAAGLGYISVNGATSTITALEIEG
jgi:hypothetical protein